MAGLKKIAAILTRPRYWPALAHGVAPTVEHGPALRALEFSTVIDVGASKGQFAYFAHRQWPDAQLLCFEPLPGPRARLSRLLNGSAEIFGCALGNAESEADMHVADRADSSSLLPIGRRQEAIFNTRETGRETVPEGGRRPCPDDPADVPRGRRRGARDPVLLGVAGGGHGQPHGDRARLPDRAAHRCRRPAPPISWPPCSPDRRS